MNLKNTMVWGQSHKGYKRRHNEDRFLIKESSGITILAVADGVAGSTGGEIAAQIVIDLIANYNFSKNDFKKDLKIIFVNAEEQIQDKKEQNPIFEDMGTTATIAVLYKDKIFWAHVGDSRMYIVKDDKFKQITTDHTFIQDMIDDGTLTLEQAKIHPLRNMLDQCVGCGETQPDTGILTIKKNDRLLLCSDGLTKHLSDLQIASILGVDCISKAGQQLIQTALKMGGADNVTVIVKGL